MSLLRERQPDLMLLDLIMPGMDGSQVLHGKGKGRAIRDIPAAIITSRNPTDEPVVSDMLVVSRGGGLSVRESLTCTHTVECCAEGSLGRPGTLEAAQQAFTPV